MLFHNHWKTLKRTAINCKRCLWLFFLCFTKIKMVANGISFSEADEIRKKLKYRGKGLSLDETVKNFVYMGKNLFE